MKTVFLFLLLATLAGCDYAEKKAPSVLTVNGIGISKQDFEDAYLMYNASQPNEISRKDFLDVYINRILLLDLAEEKGLNQDRRFLKSIENFWQTTLLKLVLERQFSETTARIEVAEEEIREYFEKNKDFYGDKSYEEKRERIRYILEREKQQKAMDDWMKALRSKASVHIDEEKIGIK